ncbi:MAG: exodeoxyribonuclease III [Lactobacillales bacterium]|jgi:exodeoxyribonuclease-3|nr:exodeoxyribonuclease III [Lactobacillales bacterium]
MKFISWNVNGLRAILQKDFIEDFARLDADIVGLQETKLQEGQTPFEPEGYHAYWNYSRARKGYSGVAVFSKAEPLNVTYGIGVEEYDIEGRVITLEFADYYFITCYTPNSGSELKRLDFRQSWEDVFLKYLNGLDKPVVLCGDLNVAHTEIDLKNPKTNRKNAGFTDEERTKFDVLLSNGYVDTFRHFYPTQEQIYSWWSYRFSARKNNSGWRIDYFITSESLNSKLVDAKILNDYMGSDHCPVELDIEV